MSKNRVVASQPHPDVWDYEHRWQMGFCECCDDCGQCCFAFFCFCCFSGTLFKRTGECCCLFCVPCSYMALRSKLRTGFRIRGSICNDCLATSFCPLCAAIQMKGELDRQEL